MNKVQLIFLGKQKQPYYGKTDEDVENEVIKFYKVIYSGNYRVGDGVIATTTQQFAFGCSRNLEVYKIHQFEDIDGYILDNDLVSLDDYIEEHCSDLIEIYDE
jgi:hypothetical protein